MESLANYKNPLLTIPDKKAEETLQAILREFVGDDGVISTQCSILLESVRRYIAANVPIDYIFREMDDFVGDKILVKTYNEIAADIGKVYSSGSKYCFAGNCGTGKTFTCACILKKAADKGYSGLYTTLADIINILSSKDQDKHEARKLLIEIDFLVIDEFDPRFMGSEAAAELYGRIIEPILRNRIQNKLPMFFCTNNPKPTSGFTGALKESISSLMNTVTIVPVLGKDHRGVTKK